MKPNSEALEAADTIATTLRDPRTAWAKAPPGGRAWPQSLAGGAAGVALLHIERARCGRGDWDTAHAWLSSAVGGNLTVGANAGLFMGAPAVAFVVNAAADSSARYQRALEKLDAATIAVTRRRLADARARIDGGNRPALREFDLIRGLAGLGVYHLARHPHHEITRDVLAYLVRLTEPLPDDGLPAWWTNLSPNGRSHPDFSGGHGNLGLSHGIGSVLALLSLTLLRGLAITDTRNAIERICVWTDKWRQQEATGPWWPGFITPDQVHNRRIDPGLRPRPSWCYGIAGTARAQQLAGMALGDTTRQEVAEIAMLTTLRDPAQLDLLPEIGLCHGKAGLLQAAWRMASDARTPGIAAEIAGLATRFSNQLAQPVTDPELLDGAAGAGLTLHTLGTGTAPTTSWDAILLLT